MPNFAFLGLTYLVFAFPGFLYRWIYLSGEFTQQLLRKSWTDEIGKAVLIAIPFHALWIGVFEVFKHAGSFSYTVTSLTAFELLSGTYPEPAQLVTTLYENTRYIVSYYLAVSITACVAGYRLRKLVWSRELDVQWPLLKYRNDWLYTIMGRGKLENVKQDETVAIIDVLTDQDAGVPGKTILYRGRAAAFDTNDDGTLRHIRLVEVMRGGFEKSEPWGKPKFVLNLVPGDVFVIDYSRVRNMNISYVTKASYFSAVAELESVGEPSPANPPASPPAPAP